MCIRDSLAISAIFFCSIVAGVVFIMRKQDFSSNVIKYTAASIFTIFAASSFLSYNRDTLSLFYYGFGYFIPILLSLMVIVLFCTDKFSQKVRERMTIGSIILFMIMIIFTESRVSAINVIMLLMLLTPIFLKLSLIHI